ncbi:tyrosine-type recombinase/integrase [uncultured Parasphingorhabdus sp.]|uniref:tyrosine-type recombinase/integrase n=1 Tax=uncultured Parasphingorhabdus sp. TaxID=2709694 RepID=UPI0030D9D75F|tara:strand:- start:9050 stop:10240 length:1191 start_codon:yes stop_codon:yes gene_type:complete
MTKLTKRMIEGLKIKDKDYFVWESELSGFGVRVFPTGRIKFVLQYRHGRTSRRMSLGQYGALTVDQARGLAIENLAKIRNDIDPLQEKRERRTALTVNELASRFDDEHCAVHLKTSTAKEYRRNLKLFILPAIGSLRITDVTRADISKYHHDWRHRPYQANRNLEIISKIFNLAELWGLRPDGTNPRRHIKKYPEKKRERYYSAGELRSIGRVLSEMEDEHIELPSAIAAVRLLLFTGCRLNEIMKLEWQWVDLGNYALNLPDSKTGAKTVHLGQAAVDVIEQIDRHPDNPYVIVGRNPGAHLTDLQPFWQRVRGRAGLKDARIHDLRHTFASVAVSNGMSLPMIGKLLGHTQVQTTARYAHLATEPIIAAANDITTLIAESLKAAERQEDGSTLS